MEVLSKMQSDEPKKSYQSKTVWIGLLTALLPLYPPAAAWVALHPELFSAAVGALFSGLRLISSDRVVIK